MATNKWKLIVDQRRRRRTSSFIYIDLETLSVWCTDLHQSHVGSLGQLHLLRLGGVGVVSVSEEPLLQRSHHVLDHSALLTRLLRGGIPGADNTF